MGEGALERIAGGNRRSVYSISVKDVYGDYGIAGGVIVDMAGKRWLISSYLLSCRVLGKDIEYAVLSWLVDRAKRDGVDTVTIRYSRTEKNAPALRFLEANGIRISAHKRCGDAVILHNGRSAFAKMIDHVKVVKA